MLRKSPDQYVLEIREAQDKCNIQGSTLR